MQIRRIGICGGGTAGWIAASVLARVLHASAYTIHVIDSGGADESLGPHSPALATLPSARLFHGQFGYDENDIIAQASGCFTLGTAISAWTATGTPCFHPLGDTGAPMGHIGFHHLASRLRAQGKTINLPDYALAALCAQANRFQRPAQNSSSVLSTLDYGLLLDSAAYTDFFRKDAKARGVTVQNGIIENVMLDEDGLIDGVHMADGSIHNADLYVDCTGADARVIGSMPGVAFQDWGHWLPCNQIIHRHMLSSDAPPPYVHMLADTAGWTRHIATRTHMCETHQTRNDGTSEAGLYASGRRSEFWVGNCIALGAAAATIDPLSPLSLHLLQASVRRLINLFPNDRVSPIEAQNYTMQTEQELEGARDWAILPYKINGHGGQEFWNHCRDMAIPDRLNHRIELYKATGRIALYDGDIMEEADWISLYDAQAIYPRRYDAAADGITVAAIDAHFAKIREIMLHEISQMPFHQDYLKGIVQ